MAYLLLAWYASQPATHNLFDLVQSVHVFDIDDTYRRFLSSVSFSTPGIWFWDFYLPGNLLFDGFFSWLTGHSEFWMRVPHVLAFMLGMMLVYRSGLRLGVSSGWLLASSFALLLMPLNALLAMSFYGESLLCAAMCVVIYSLATDNRKTLVPAVVAMPFFRPEGAFYLGFIVLQKLLRKHWWLACLILLPCVLYGMATLSRFDFSLDNFFAARRALGAHYPLAPPAESSMGYSGLPYYTINPFWWGLGLMGALLPTMKRLRPLFIGAVYLMLYWFWKSWIGDARNEPRYLFSMFPLFVLSQAALLDAVCRFAKARWKQVARMGGGLLVAAIVLENFAQLDPLRAHFANDRRWPVAGETGAAPAFVRTPDDIIQWQKETADYLRAYVAYDSSIKRVMVDAWPLFNALKASDFPARVRVEYSPMKPQAVFRYYDSYFYSMYPELPHYSFYRLGYAGGTLPNDGASYALYVGPLFNGVYDPLFANPVFQIWKVRYREMAQSSFYHP